jgi:hypothetical protein
MFEEDVAFGEEQVAGGGMFPFLSVMICTIGLMVFVLIGGSISSRLKMRDVNLGARLRANLENVEQREREAAAALDSVRQRYARLEDPEKFTADIEAKRATVRRDRDLVSQDTAKLAGAIGDERQIKKARENRAKAATALLKKLAVYRELTDGEAKRATAEEKRDTVAGELQKLTGDVSRLEAAVTRLDSDRKRIKAKLASPEVPFTISGIGKDTTVAVLDLHAAEVRVSHAHRLTGFPDTIPAEGAHAPGGTLERLAAELAKPGAKGLAVLLVRPDAVDLYARLRRLFLKWRVPVRHEPFEDHWRVGELKLAP